MIFTSLGILVAAGGFLIAGIVRSSIPLLVVSLIGTAAAAFILLATADLARRRAWENQGLPVAAGGMGGGPPGTQPVVMYVPVAESAEAVSAGVATGGNGTGSPIPGYDVMTATQINKIITSGDLTREQLDAVRRYEKAHGSRKTILDKVDRALSS
jgi:hypothetical protein